MNREILEALGLREGAGEADVLTAINKLKQNEQTALNRPRIRTAPDLCRAQSPVFVRVCRAQIVLAFTDPLSAVGQMRLDLYIQVRQRAGGQIGRCRGHVREHTGK